MGLLDGLIGGMIGGALAPIVTNFLNQQGGVQGIVNSFENKGLGSTVHSWVQSGPNAPVTADHVTNVFGQSAIDALAAKAGLNPADMATKLAQVLPHAVDHMTPDGVVPPHAAAAPTANMGTPPPKL